MNSNESPTSEPRREIRLARWLLALSLLVLLVVSGWLAWTIPLGNYFYDERFSLRNVAWMIGSGSLLPHWYYWYAPPAFVPQAWAARSLQWISQATGRPSLAAYRTEPRLQWERPGIFVQRSFGLFYSAVALWALARLGKRIASPLAGGLAAFAVATTPWLHLVAAGFKPDPLLLMLTVLCFLPLMRFAESDRWRDLLLAALLMGAATAAKLNGALLAAPIGVAALLSAGRFGRRLGRAAAAACVSIATYLALSPYPLKTLEYIEKLDQGYRVRGRGLDWLDMLTSYACKMRQWRFLGAMIAVAAVVAVAVIATQSLRRRPLDVPGRRWLLVLTFSLVQLAFLVKAAGYPKENHLFQVVPLLLLPLSALFARALRSMQERRTVAASLIALWLAVSGVRMVDFMKGELAVRVASPETAWARESTPQAIEAKPGDAPDQGPGVGSGEPSTGEPRPKGSKRWRPRQFTKNLC